MRSIRRNNRILGVLTLMLVCLTFTAAPASAFLERGGFDPGNDADESLGSRFTLVLSNLGDSFFAALQKLGVIFAQDGARVED